MVQHLKINEHISIHHINRLKKTSYKYINRFRQNPTPIHSKNLNKPVTKRYFLILIRNSYKTHTANIICNGEKLDVFPLSSLVGNTSDLELVRGRALRHHLRLPT